MLLSCHASCIIETESVLFTTGETMITAYHRPQTLDEALTLLAQPDTLPLAGGTRINTPEYARDRGGDFAVVDLQALKLDGIHKAGNNLQIGACATLQQVCDSPHVPAALKEAIRLESALNIRNAASVGGSLLTCSGRSTFGTAMLAMDARLTIETAAPAPGAAPRSAVHALGDLFALRAGLSPRGLITLITLPLNTSVAFEMVARTPADRPIVCAALAHWASGRTRLALGGWGKAPLLAMDGTEPDGIAEAARSAYEEAGDEWASAEYRANVAATLAKRCLEAARA
jgi:CO/xanthine dehydrogenase FAD-binding subunit